MLKVIGKNSTVTALEDIISAGGTLTLPTEARIHAFVSSSAEDDNDGTTQIETATLVGTITGSGDITVTVTSALVTGSPLAITVAVLENDTPSDVATKVKAALNATAAVTAHYTIGGTAATYSLTAKVAAANDSTLNLAHAVDTATGLTTASTSANTRSGYVGTGAHTIFVSGVTDKGREENEIITLNGTTSVNSVRKYKYINDMYVVTCGSNGSNVGAITATAATDSTVTATMSAGDNRMMQAIFMSDASSTVRNIYVSAINATSGAITQFIFWTRNQGANRVWVPYHIVEVNSNEQSKFLPGNLITMQNNTVFKITATPSAGTSICNVSFEAI